MSDDRDYFAKGADAAISGRSDIPPNDVTEAGLDAEASWNDGYNSIVEESLSTE